MKNKTKGAAEKDGSATAYDSEAAAGQLKREGEDGDVNGPGKMGYTQNFGPSRQGSYAKGAARVNSIMKGAPQNDIVSGSTIEMDTKGKKLTTNVVSNPSGGGSSSQSSKPTFSEAYKKVDKTKYPTLESFSKAAKAYNIANPSGGTSSSTDPKTTTNVTKDVGSVKTQVDAGLSELQKNITTEQYTNLLTEERAISDSIVERKASKRTLDLGGANAFLKQEMLEESGMDVPISKAGKVSEEQVLDVVSGKAADEARVAGGSTKSPQNVYIDHVAPTGTLYKARTGGGSTETHTGFSYEDIMNKSGGYSMNEAGNYVGGGRKKGGSKLKGAARINSIMGGARIFKK
tara:strand:- start:272 stop:1309 length:1038 start_codon:yes stop_codon:yes gene_type:complete